MLTLMHGVCVRAHLCACVYVCVGCCQRSLYLHAIVVGGTLSLPARGRRRAQLSGRRRLSSRARLLRAGGAHAAHQRRRRHWHGLVDVCAVFQSARPHCRRAHTARRRRAREAASVVQRFQCEYLLLCCDDDVSLMCCFDFTCNIGRNCSTNQRRWLRCFWCI